MRSPRGVHGDARRRTDRGGRPRGGQGDRVPGGALRGHGQGLRLLARHQRRPGRARGRAPTAWSVDNDAPHAQRAGPGGPAADHRSRHRRGAVRHRAADLLHLQRYLSANCFGDHYTRTGLDLRTRELLTFAMLVSLGGCEPQVAGHIAANLRVGNGRARLIDVLTQLLPYIGYPRTLNGLRAIDDVAPILVTP
ncbi:carboxymuconolactone decarboxylase family protein [Pengzhenrongella phosphoraccumulans]|uniref:carboxymuconolactone decarboxylase family protein n=1 Tax=Pengzhenrongella phosphoraccumulans TaxID=3114394 RepID=UPI00388F69FB